MPRMARTKSETGIYHVVLRGIKKQRTFEDDEDKKMLIHFSKLKSSSGYGIYGYCLTSITARVLTSMSSIWNSRAAISSCRFSSCLSLN